MKKICAILLALAFLFFMCACIDDTEKEDISDYFEDKSKDVAEEENELKGSLIHYLNYRQSEISKIY